MIGRSDIVYLIDEFTVDSVDISGLMLAAEAMLTSGVGFSDEELEGSLARYILRLLASSDLNLIIGTDVLFYRELLSDDRLSGLPTRLRDIDEHDGRIDYSRRKDELRNLKLYRPYCN